jgi:alpha-L-fucosidase
LKPKEGGAILMEHRFAALALALTTLGTGHAVCAQAVAGNDRVPEKRATARGAFQDDRFGLFIHWGVYSLVGEGEWVMEHDKLPIHEYDKLPPRFNPTRFDADAWVKLAKSAGAKYITITSKHHDGFCMFDSKLTAFDIVDSSPYHADPLKALAGACHEQKIKLFFYYSLLDWHNPDYFPLGKTGEAAGREIHGNWKDYVAYYQGQIRELCTNYGEIGGIWLDGCWDRPDADWDLAGTYRMIHELQPSALVGNNQRAAPSPGEDFQIVEQDLRGEGAAGSSSARISSGLALETCMTINRSWGFNSRDKEYKSSEAIIRALVSSAGRGANLLLNLGPKPDGSIDHEVSERLVEVGAWLKTYGETIYGTRRGPLEAQSWGVSTTKGARADQRIYLHILKPKTGEPIVFDRSISWTPFLFGKTTPLKWNRKPGVLELDLPEDAVAPVDTIVVLHPEATPRAR